MTHFLGRLRRTVKQARNFVARIVQRPVLHVWKKGFLFAKRTPYATRGAAFVAGLVIAFVVGGSVLTPTETETERTVAFESVEQYIAFTPGDGGQGYVIPASSGSGKGYSQATYYSQGSYYSQGGYYSQGSYYSQGGYYSQGSYYGQSGYGGGYSQGSYPSYSQGSYPSGGGGSGGGSGGLCGGSEILEINNENIVQNFTHSFDNTGTINFEYRGIGGLDSSGSIQDNFDLFYRVDGGSWVRLAETNGSPSPNPLSGSQDITGGSGSSVTIQLLANTTAGAEAYCLDELEVVNTGEVVSKCSAGVLWERGGSDAVDSFSLGSYTNTEEDRTIEVDLEGLFSWSMEGNPAVPNNYDWLNVQYDEGSGFVDVPGLTFEADISRNTYSAVIPASDGADVEVQIEARVSTGPPWNDEWYCLYDYSIEGAPTITITGGVPDINGGILVDSGERVDVDWELNGNDPANCVLISGHNDSNVNDPNDFHPITSDRIYGDTHFRITCDGGSDSTNVRVRGEFEDF